MNQVNLKNNTVMLVWVVALLLGFSHSANATFKNQLKSLTAVNLSPFKPLPTAIVKEKTIQRVSEEYDVITSSEWKENGDFYFINAAMIRAPLRFTRSKVLDFSLYKQMSSAMQKFEYDEKTDLIEITGQAGGLRMHSWIKVDIPYYDEIHYEIVRGDMTGFKVDAFLWERSGKTLTIARGTLPGGKNRFPLWVVLIFKPLSEGLISVATKKFRSYIEDEYKKNREVP